MIEEDLLSHHKALCMKAVLTDDLWHFCCEDYCIRYVRGTIM